MSFNCIGNLLRLTTFGESHGPCIGGILDGFPANVQLDLNTIQTALDQRKPGGESVSPRKEDDKIQILSGVEDSITTGAPIAFSINNTNAKKTAYNDLKSTVRPGHANATYHAKYGHFSQSGGGRASARETAVRVAAGAICAQLFKTPIEFLAWVDSVGPYKSQIKIDTITHDMITRESLFCPDSDIVGDIKDYLSHLQKEGDSCGGNIRFLIRNAPMGLGEPIYQKMEAYLAYAMMSIPASKGFEIGSGFNASQLLGSEHNDIVKNQFGQTQFNYAGGILGGITNGDPIYGRVGFKPTSSIKKPQNTYTFEGDKVKIEHGKAHRHDPCVAIRAVPIVKAMCQIVLADLYLCQMVRTGQSHHVSSADVS